MKLEIEKLVKSYGDNLVLDNINFEFESNKIYVLLGRNGSGKTTFFNCINQDIDMIKSLPELFQGLSKVLCVEASSYRYAYSIDKKQCVKTKSSPFTKDNESPNIKALWPLFKESYYASLYTIMLLDYLCPEQNS